MPEAYSPRTVQVAADVVDAYRHSGTIPGHLASRAEGLGLNIDALKEVADAYDACEDESEADG